MEAQRAKKIVGMIMPSLRNSMAIRGLSINSMNVLQYILFVATLHGMQNSSGAIYCVPSEERIAGVVKLHRVTVSRIVSLLQSEGFLMITHRRPLNGKWATNLYRLSKTLWVKYGNVINQFKPAYNRVAALLHLVSKTVKSFNPRQEFKAFSYKLKSKEWSDIEKDFYARRPDLV